MKRKITVFSGIAEEERGAALTRTTREKQLNIVEPVKRNQQTSESSETPIRARTATELRKWNLYRLTTEGREALSQIAQVIKHDTRAAATIQHVLKLLA